MPALPFALAALSLIWVSVLPAEAYSVAAWALLAPFLAAIILSLLWKIIGPHKCKSMRARLINGLIGLACLAVYVSVPYTHWPLRLAYKVSRPSFDAMAQSLQSGVRFQGPMWVGLFKIEKAEVYEHNGKVCLWTYLHPNGSTGFTQCPPDDVPFNLWSKIELDASWQLVSED